MKLELEKVCYVVVQVGVLSPIAKHKNDLIWYPERSMTMLDTINYRPYIQSIVTENPWIIACYDAENVRVWDSEYGEWKRPDRQTYGAAISSIINMIGVRREIPSIAWDGGTEIEELKSKIQQSYKNSEVS